MAKEVVMEIDSVIQNAAEQYISTNTATFKGDNGESLTLNDVVDNGNGTLTLTFSDGTVHTTSDLTGPQGLPGPEGDSLTLTSITNNPDKTLRLDFSDGTYHITDPVKGEDGLNLTILNVVDNSDGTLDLEFSDGTVYTTPDLQGPRGFKGDTGDHVHHISYQRSKDDLGNEVGPVTPGQSGYDDTYAMWTSQEEYSEMFIGEFTVHNGYDGLAPEDQNKLDSMEWSAKDDQDASEVPFDTTVLETTATDVQGVIEEIVPAKEDITNKGMPNGYAGLDGSGKIPSTQLPSYVDDVLVFPTYADLPNPGEEGKLYIIPTDETSGDDTSTYRWTTAGYAQVSNTLDEADVKVLYETNVNTNVYTDAEKDKVSNVPVDTNAMFDTKVDKVTGSSLVEDVKVADYDDHLVDAANPHNVTTTQIGAYTTTEVDSIAATKQNILSEGAFVDGDKTKLDNIEDGATADQIAAEVPVVPQGSLSSSTVQLALEELQTNVDTINQIKEW